MKKSEKKEPSASQGAIAQNKSTVWTCDLGLLLS